MKIEARKLKVTDEIIQLQNFMKFMGSKSRIAKYILPIMLKNRKEGQVWVEPFVACSSLTKYTGSKRGIEKLFIYNPFV